jgi:hypothetical protein
MSGSMGSDLGSWPPVACGDVGADCQANGCDYEVRAVGAQLGLLHRAPAPLCKRGAVHSAEHARAKDDHHQRNANPRTDHRDRSVPRAALAVVAMVRVRRYG